MKYCIKCGNVIDDNALFCPNCGASQKQIKAIKKPISSGQVILIIFAAFLCILLLSFILKGYSDRSGKATPNSTQSSRSTQETSNKNDPLIIRDYDTSKHIPIHEDVLYEYADLFLGEKIITVVTVSDSTSSRIKAHTSNDDSYTFQFVFEFNNTDYNIKNVKDEEIYTIAGTVEKISGSYNPTVYITDCVLIGNGEILNTLSDNKETQISSCLDKLKEKEELEKPLIIDDFDTSDYILIDADILFEYADLFKGEKIVTVITVKDSSKDKIKANTSSNESFTYSFVFTFEHSEYNIENVKEGQIYTIAGTLDDISTFLHTTVYLSDCSLIGNGELSDYLTETKDQQISICLEKRQEIEDAQAEATQKEKDEYKTACEVINYKSIERNPDSYKGKKIKVSGTVIQVLEGWFDSVTIRLEDNNGDIWYITYYRSDGESRILEDDYITCYGECDGVESYTSVLGAQITLPSIKMEYYDQY